MDDLISGGPTIPAARQVKETSSDIFARGVWTLLWIKINVILYGA